MDGKVLKKQDGKMRAESRWGGGEPSRRWRSKM